MGKELVVEQTGKVFRGVFFWFFFGGQQQQHGGDSQKMVDVDALNLCHMNKGGQNHVTYYEPEKSSGGSARREEQRGRNVMDKGSNEAGKGYVVRERREKKESTEEGWRERRARCRVERRRVGGSKGMCLAARFFSRSVCARMTKRGSTRRAMEGREKRDESRKKKEMRV